MKIASESPLTPPPDEAGVDATRRRCLLGAAALGATTVLGGCAGMDLTSVSRVDARSAAAVAPGRAVVLGRVRWMVDGQPLRYHFLNRPHLQLFDRATGMLLSTPETDREGWFAWQLPAADYGVAVIFGGMGPTGQPHFLPRGGLVFVNGIVDPGFEIRVLEGERRYVGTLEVSVESRLPTDVWFGKERVFGRMLGMRVLDESSIERERGLDGGVAVDLLRAIPRRPRAA